MTFLEIAGSFQLITSPEPPRRIIWGGRKIAVYLNKPARWFWRQRDFGRNCPPHHKDAGGAIFAYADELDAWLSQAEAQII